MKPLPASVERDRKIPPFHAGVHILPSSLLWSHFYDIVPHVALKLPQDNFSMIKPKNKWAIFVPKMSTYPLKLLKDISSKVQKVPANTSGYSPLQPLNRLAQLDLVDLQHPQDSVQKNCSKMQKKKTLKLKVFKTSASGNSQTRGTINNVAAAT